MQVNADPLKVETIPVCRGCKRRAPWCNCGAADYADVPVERKPYDLLLAEERLILAASEAIEEIMEKAGVNRTELAKRCGVSKAAITGRLTGANLTLKSLAGMAHALGYRLEFTHAAVTEYGSNQK